ncbi:MAG: TlpA disulfide reductase family protein [Archangium sp.]|nr:TlpA disulfide reductase family protein [Archangium sp.]
MRLSGCLTLIILAGCTRAAPSSHRSDAPLDFTLPTYPSKEPFSLSSERGHVVMLDVWATWCEPCRESLPQYQALAGKYAARGLRLYALNVDGDAAVPAEIPKFITETKLSLPILLDTDAKLSEETLKVKVMPTALLIDRKGVVRHVHEGFESTSLAEVVGHLESLLAEP